MTSSTDHDRLSAPFAQAPKAGDALGRETAAFAMQPDVIEVAEEFATVGVERRDMGGVRVRLETRSFEDLMSVDLASERLDVTRHPVGHEIDVIPDMREDGDLLIVPVVEERAVVVTKLFLTEEIHIRRVRSTEKVDVPVNLRRQTAVIEQLEPGSVGPDASFAAGSDERPA